MDVLGEVSLCDHTLLCFQVDPKALEKSLTQRTVMTIKESVSKTLDSIQAVDGKDAFVKVMNVTPIFTNKM